MASITIRQLNPMATKASLRVHRRPAWAFPWKPIPGAPSCKKASQEQGESEQNLAEIALRLLWPERGIDLDLPARGSNRPPQLFRIAKRMILLNTHVVSELMTKATATPGSSHWLEGSKDRPTLPGPPFTRRPKRRGLRPASEGTRRNRFELSLRPNSCGSDLPKRAHFLRSPHPPHASTLPSINFFGEIRTRRSANWTCSSPPPPAFLFQGFAGL